MTFASKRNLCAFTYHTLFSHKPTRLHTHAKQNLFKHVFLFLSCLQEFLLPPVRLMLQSYLIVEGVSYRSLADNTDGQCPSQGSCLGLRLNSPTKWNPTVRKWTTRQGFHFVLMLLTDREMFETLGWLRMEQQSSLAATAVTQQTACLQKTVFGLVLAQRELSEIWKTNRKIVFCSGMQHYCLVCHTSVCCIVLIFRSAVVEWAHNAVFQNNILFHYSPFTIQQCKHKYYFCIFWY